MTEILEFYAGVVESLAPGLATWFGTILAGVVVIYGGHLVSVALMWRRRGG